MFPETQPPRPSAAETAAFVMALCSCIGRIIAGTSRKKRGAHLDDILKDAEYRNILASQGIMENSPLQQILDLFSLYGIPVRHYKDSQRYYIKLP